MIKNIFKTKNIAFYALNFVKQEQRLNTNKKFYFSTQADEDISDPSQ